MPSNAVGSILPKSPYGIKFAKAGFDTRSANDYELLFNSAWPSLAIAFTTTVVLPTGVGHVAHPLNFPPFTMAWAVHNDVVTHRHFPNVSNTTLFFTDINTDASTYYIQCYNLDISKQVNYTYIPTPPAQIGVYDVNYGAKFAKPGKSVDSKNLNDFIFHTRAMSPAILSVNTTFDTIPAVVGSLTITTNNPSNYIPWAFGYGQAASNPGVWVFAPPYAQAIPRLFVNLVQPNSFTLSAFGDSPGGSLIMLRDPLFVANSVDVVF